jgi:hypothetical protein
MRASSRLPLSLSKKISQRRRGSYLSQQGAALVIVLCFVVLLTVLIVAFLLQSNISRQIFNARAGQTEVDVLGSSVVQFMKADFRQEIVSGSIPGATYIANNTAGTPVPVYVPANNMNAVPSRTGFAPGATATADPYANIVKISKFGTNFFSGASFTNLTTYPSPNYASPVSTATPGLNGRYIDSAATGWTTNGWDKPQLIDTTAYPAALGNAVLPDWDYVTSGGRKVLTQPEADVVGRYAYVVYDEGGLLDINSAGYNTALSTADAYDVARKGSLGLADITQIPGITSTIRDALVSWRNATTSSSSYTTNTTMFTTNTSSFLQYMVDGNLNSGFLKTYPGDQKFISRQDLLAYQAAGNSGMTAQSLAYLGTFSRALNAPTYTPIDSPGETFSPVTTYAANAENLDWSSSVAGTYIEPVYNRDVANLRWPADVTITRPKLDDDSGTASETVTFHKGDPVLQHRFPLSKLQLLTKLIANPTAGGVVAIGTKPTVGTIAWAVLYYFGLEWDAAGDTTLGVDNPGSTQPHWEYVDLRQYESGDGSAGAGLKYMCSIGEVANSTATVESTTSKTFLNREPNFFELLAAGILRGSTSPLNIYDIGASVIDQSTPTDVPTTIAYGGRLFVGRKNLPYFCQFLFWPYRPSTTATTPYTGESDTFLDNIEAYLLPVVWNPNRNASTPSTTITNLRMYLYDTGGGGIYAYLSPNVNGNTVTNGTTTPQHWSDTTPLYQASNVPALLPDPVPANLSNYIITFSNSADFAEPTLLSTKYVTSPVPTDPNFGNAPVGGLSQTPNTRWGFFLGSASVQDATIATRTGQTPVQAPWYVPPPNAILPQYYPAATTMTLTGTKSTGSKAVFRLQCKGTDGNWYTYAEMGMGVWSPTITATDSAGAKIGFSGSGYNASPSFSNVNAPINSSIDAYDYVAAIAAQNIDPRVSFISNINNVASSSPYVSPAGLYITSLGGSNPSSQPPVTPPVGATLRPYPDLQTSHQSQLTSALTGRTYPDVFGTPLAVPVTTYAGLFSENNVTGSIYTDNASGALVWNGGTAVLTGDGVTRPGDGVNGAYPLALTANGGSVNYRPIILNRPFLSVGELGYTFRAEEWKTLDFSTAVSGDSGLLDLFSINDTENANQQSMISGVVNLNTHNPAVLQSLISGGLINGLDATGSGITSADAGDRREAVVRALAEPSDTRTWNLLIDLVAQAGRYPPTAISAGTTAALSQFDVQGERHYWLHLAIDRYTGKVIDEQLEVVHDN